MTAPRISHICGDYPNVFQSGRRQSSHAWSMASPRHNFVFSINRVNSPLKEQIKREENLWSIRCFAPPLGIIQSFFLDRLARLLARCWRRTKYTPFL